LRELTPATSYGFEVIDFARDVLEHPLLPWQEFAVIHGGELLPDGRPRFRIVLLLVSRQNGKTELPVVLSATGSSGSRCR
jgi:phage terminase large subunit-like protein